MCDRGVSPGAPIGSTCRFFPNKTTIVHALRTKFGSDYEYLLIAMEKEASGLTLERLVGCLLKMTVRFVEEHPAFLALLDAWHRRSPSITATRSGCGWQACLRAVRPGNRGEEALRVATILLHPNDQGIERLYGEVSAVEQKRVAEEYRLIISSYLAAPAGRTGYEMVVGVRDAANLLMAGCSKSPRALPVVEPRRQQMCGLLRTNSSSSLFSATGSRRSMGP